MDILKELSQFLEELKQYKEILTNPDSKLLEAKRKNEYLADFPFIQDALPKKSKEEVIEELREYLVRKSGGLTKSITDIIGKDIYIEKFGRTYDIWRTGLAANPSAPINFDCLNACIDITNEAIGKLEAAYKVEEEKSISELFSEEPKKLAPKTSPKNVNYPKAFISHGKESTALRKLKEFIETLGIEPLIVKKLASMDHDLPEKVNLYLGQADFVIILATGDDIVTDKSTGKKIKQPRQNVIHEVGLAQKTLPGKIIYLLEAGTVFPSNISPKVWERFKQRNMLNAFLCILRELRALGILLAIKPK